MRQLRRAANRDKGERAIVDALLDAGAFVRQLDVPDFVDLFVAYKGTAWLLEVKAPVGPNGGANHSSQKLSEGQVEFFAKCAVHNVATVRVVRSPEEALRVVGAVTSYEEATR